jgi:hypothetical protein
VRYEYDAHALLGRRGLLDLASRSGSPLNSAWKTRSQYALIVHRLRQFAWADAVDLAKWLTEQIKQ